MPANATQERASVRIKKVLKDYWPSAVGSLAYAGVLISGLFLTCTVNEEKQLIPFTFTSFKSHSGAIFIVSAIGVILTSVVNAMRAKQLSSLSTKVEAQDEKLTRIGASLERLRIGYRDLLEGRLSKFSNIFGFGNTERISVYKHKGNSFVLLGRYSVNPEFQKPGRTTYPDNQGCIGVAFRDGESFENELPDYDADPDAYVSTSLDRWRIKKGISRKLTMKSRSYAGFAIESPMRRERIAVIVFESMQTNVLHRDELRTVLDGMEGRWLMEFLEITKSFEPEPSYARQEGY